MSQTSTLQRILKNTLTPLAAQVVVRLMDFAFAIFMVRYLGPANVGKYAFAVFLIGYFLLQTLLFKLPLSFDPTVLFFAIVMLPEPMTSPIRPKLQIAFGITVAVLAILLSHPWVTLHIPIVASLPDPLIIALLISNATFFNRK